MKHKITLLTICLFLSTTINYAQQKVEAYKIMNDIKAGKSISYENKTIVGTLDFTYMKNALEKLPRKKKNTWFNWSNNGSSNVIEKIIETKVSFVNCTFKDNVLAYIPDEHSGYTFTASFEQDAIFKDCTFENKAMFKYSKFERDSDFSGSKFEDDSTFKYAKFNKKSSFSNTIFNETATFKYAEFKNNVSFSNSIFKDTAIFKYTEFFNGVSFRNSRFEEDINMKYTNVNGDFDITGMKVAYDIDTKYTKINGNSFGKYSLDKN